MKKFSKILKNTLVFMLSFIMVFSSMIFAASDTAFAAEDTCSCITYNKELYENNKGLCDRLADGIKNLDEQIYIGDFQITSKESMRYIIKTVIRKHPELFYVDTTKYMLGLDGNIIAVICPVYLFDKQTIREKIDIFNAECDKYLEKINSSMTEFEKAVVLHDRLILNCEYLDEDGTGHVSAYEAIVNKNANCQGYSEAYSYLLSRVGIHSEIVESSAMYHLWNKVRIDNIYYNVDLTWDDPMPDKAGRVLHKYFLLSDKAISKVDNDTSGHYGFGYAYYKSKNTKYDNGLFHEFDSQFCFVDNDCYVIDNKYQSKYERCLLKYDTKTDAAQVVKQFDYRWKSGTSSYWKGGYMSLDENDGLLYLNSSDCIYSYDTATNTMKEFAKVDTSSGDCYGLRINDNDVYAVISANPNMENKLQYVEKCVENKIITTPALMMGDVNFDGKINIVDVTEIQKYSSGTESFTAEQLLIADYNNDGIVSILDATGIQKAMVGI